MDYRDPNWLYDESECTTENFIRFVIRRERCPQGVEHRRRLKSIIYDSWEQYFDLPRIQTHMAYEEEVAATWLWLNQQPAPVLLPDENLYLRFQRKLIENMKAKMRKRCLAQQQKEKWQRDMQLFLFGIETDSNKNERAEV